MVMKKFIKEGKRLHHMPLKNQPKLFWEDFQRP